MVPNIFFCFLVFVEGDNYFWLELMCFVCYNVGFLISLLHCRSKLSVVNSSSLQKPALLPSGVKLPQSVLSSEPITPTDITFVSIAPAML